MDSICKFINKDYNGQSGAGECHCNECIDKINAGLGYGRPFDAISRHKGTGRAETSKGYGMAKGYNYHSATTFKAFNYNEYYR